MLHTYPQRLNYGNKKPHLYRPQYLYELSALCYVTHKKEQGCKLYIPRHNALHVRICTSCNDYFLCDHKGNRNGTHPLRVLGGFASVDRVRKVFPFEESI